MPSSKVFVCLAPPIIDMTGLLDLQVTRLGTATNLGVLVRTVLRGGRVTDLLDHRVASLTDRLQDSTTCGHERPLSLSGIGDVLPGMRIASLGPELAGQRRILLAHNGRLAARTLEPIRHPDVLRRFGVAVVGHGRSVYQVKVW